MPGEGPLAKFLAIPQIHNEGFMASDIAAYRSTFTLSCPMCQA